MSSVMLMVHSVVMMMPLFLRVMLGVVLAAPVRRIGVIDHIDAEARWLASPDLDDTALGDARLLAALMILMTRRRCQAGRAIARRLPRRHRRRVRLGRLLVVLRRILQIQAAPVDVDGEGDAVTGHQLHGSADRRHRGGRVQLQQGGLQLQDVYSRQRIARTSLPISPD